MNEVRCLNPAQLFWLASGIDDHTVARKPRGAGDFSQQQVSIMGRSIRGSFQSPFSQMHPRRRGALYLERICDSTSGQ